MSAFERTLKWRIVSYRIVSYRIVSQKPTGVSLFCRMETTTKTEKTKFKNGWAYAHK